MQGRRLRGEKGGTVPPKNLRSGDGAAYIPPIFLKYFMNIIIIATSDSEQFCSDDILKYYHYSVEIQKNLNRGVVTSPPQTPPQTQTRLKLHVSYELVPMSTQIIEQFCFDDSLKCY